MTRTHWLVLPIVLTATFVQLLSVTIVQVTITSIQRQLHAGAGMLQLVLAGYTLTYACLLITAARLGDRYGYRRLFVTGMAIFTASSVACALSPTAGMLVVSRLVQGVGSGLMAPQVLSIIQTALPSERRPHALGLFGATMGVASLVGPLLGGLLISADPFQLGWRLVFLVNVPVGLVALGGSFLLPGTRAIERPRIDVVGSVLAMTGLGLVILPLTLGPGAGWPVWTWLSGLGAVAVLALYFLSQQRGSHPLVHPGLFRDRTVRSGTLLVFVFNAAVPSFTYVLFLYVQSGLGYTALAAALTSTPFAGAAVVGSRTAALLGRTGGTRLLTGATLVLALVMAMMPVALGSDAGYRWTALPLLAVGGAAFGAFTASVFALVLAGVAPEATGSVSGLLPTAQQLGGTIGVALAGLVYFAQPGDPGAAFVHAMTYQVVVFLIAAVISHRLGRDARPAFEPHEATADPAACEPAPRRR